MEGMHDWRPNGITIDTIPPFPEKVCARCGAINWGGNEDGECPRTPSTPPALRTARSG